MDEFICNKEQKEKCKQTKSPKDLLIEQELYEIENMTEGQFADYLAEQEY